MISISKKKGKANKADKADYPESVVCSLAQLIALRGRNTQPISGQRRSSSTLMGGHRSQFRGRGMDFEEVRRYQAGDDIRHIDWRVTARTGAPHTKLFREERERPLHLVVDQSSSLFFGTQRQFKSVAAARLAALIAWQGFHQRDRVGGIVFNEHHFEDIKPITGKRGALQFIHALAKKNRELADQMTEQMTAHKPNQTPSLLTALNHLRATIKPGSFVYMISDFQNVDTEDASAIESQLSQINRHNDLMSIMIHDPAEHTLPGRTRFAISDGIEKRRIDPRSRAIQKAHQARFDRHHHRLKTLFADYGITTLTCSTAEDISPHWLTTQLASKQGAQR